ncbi:MTOR-associated protein MEAK7-like [Patiria miniata]|uniref:MTOR-associated protein MEAK7 n=1 Tax=Patiria miniata TaxID=46514 RepID=A0A914AWW5_PATMI|nr:MTOR-associated protein MEAK7-like [Patiria miniata]XP_038068611.1 MTOR-associated protein MEAK7-like [Patiria miniata]XP_038068612.1 MTOR-associated protein MEAK7-like [Patiria miniata]
MGQSSSTKELAGDDNCENIEYQGLFSDMELEEIGQTYQTICKLGKGDGETASGFSLLQLQNFIGGKLPASIVSRLHRQLEAKDEAGITRNTFVDTMACLMKGTLEEQSKLLFALVSDEEAAAMSIGQVSELIGSMLKSYEEALKTYNRMNGWELTCTPEANQKFIDLVLEHLSSDGTKPAAETKVSREDFVRWLQRTPLVQQIFADVFHLCFTAAPKSPAATASADTDTSVLHHLPSLPRCVDANWRKHRTQLDIPTLLILNRHAPHHLRDQWRFLYSSGLHGASFATLLSHITHKGPTVLLVRDTEGHLFGGFASESWEIGPSFVGSSRCFLFSLSPKVGIYESSGQNDHYMYLNIDQQTLPNGLGMGGQFDYFGLWIDQEFGQGHSRARPKCLTYDSPQLSAKEDFTIDLVEVWAVGAPPKKTEEEDENAKKSILDKDPEAQALLELIGKGRKSEGLREEDPMADIPEVHKLPTK